MSALLHTPLFGLTLTLAVYVGFERLYARVRHPTLSPVLWSIVAVILALKLLRLDYPSYARSTEAITFLLGPAVVAFGLTLHQQTAALARQARPILISLGVGSVVGIVAAAGLARLLGGSREIVASLAPKSVTTPIAMGIAERLGGIAPLTAVVVILVGVFGAVVGPPLLRALRITSPTAWGLGMGASAHAVGTARAVEEGELQGATSALAIAINGLLTALLAPLLMKLFG